FAAECMHEPDLSGHAADANDEGAGPARGARWTYRAGEFARRPDVAGPLVEGDRPAGRLAVARQRRCPHFAPLTIEACGDAVSLRLPDDDGAAVRRDRQRKGTSRAHRTKSRGLRRPRLREGRIRRAHRVAAVPARRRPPDSPPSAMPPPGSVANVISAAAAFTGRTSHGCADGPRAECAHEQ